MKYFLLFTTFIVLLFLACKTEPDTFEPDYGFDYYPLEIGQIRYYDVDTVYFRQDQPRFDSVYSEIREVITNELTNNLGDTILRVERSARDSTNAEFVVTDIYSEQIDFANIYRKEEGLRFLKLPLPPTVNKSWNGNAEIQENMVVSVAGESIEMFKNWNYRVLSVDEPEEINGQQFDQVLTVQLADTDSDIEYRYGIEKYARGVGLVYRELWILDTQCKGCCNAPDGTIPEECRILPWNERADKGFIMIQKIKN